ncbi:MAG TPA: rRNA pseudouridine synthase [Planctomycetes bacterium]|nr:rRNA pseudouridine synthase [Planctomycetota bacterium]
MSSKAHRADGDRLQKVLASAGLGSRRDCEELILTGRVEVDGEVVTELGVRVDPSKQTIRYDGEVLKVARPAYWVVHKPPGIVCTNYDPAGRTRVVDLVPSDQRLFTVGRLDRSSSGLILVTNDGDLANQLAHPRYGVDKTYLVTVAGRPEHKQLQVLVEGVRLSEGVAKVESVRIKRRKPMSTELEIVLREGKNREIRRILAKLGYKVMTLHRIAIGWLRLSDLAAGESRRLNDAELRKLRGMTGDKRTIARGTKGKRTKGRSGKSRRHSEVKGGQRPSKRSGKPTMGTEATRPRSLPETGQRQGSVLSFDDTEFSSSGEAPPAGPVKNHAPKKRRPKSSDMKKTTQKTTRKTTRRATRKKRQ